jgi:hypothetical protein
MNKIKVLAIAVVAIFAVEGANAQSVVKAKTSTTHARHTVVVESPAKSRVVVVKRKPRHVHYRKVVTVNQPGYHSKRVVVRKR